MELFCLPSLCSLSTFANRNFCYLLFALKQILLHGTDKCAEYIIYKTISFMKRKKYKKRERQRELRGFKLSKC